MTDFSHHFKKRSVDDRLDVIPLLHKGLTEESSRIPLTLEEREVGVTELRTRVACLQEQLCLLGLKPKQRVAVMLSNSADQIALIYALILLGAVWVPVNIRLRGASLSYVIQHSRPEFLIFGPEFEEVVGELTGVRAVSVDSLLDASNSSAGAELEYNADVSPQDALCVIYTSGTTGAPKGVIFTHRMLRIASEAALLVAGIQPGDRAFLWEPLCHIGGAQMLMMPFIVDAQLHVVPRFSSSQFWTQWTSARATHFHYLGGVLNVLMQLPESDGPPAPSIRVAWGAGISAAAWEPIRERFGCELRECYGMTECSSFATLNTSGTPGSIGAPLPWIGLELLDASGDPAPKGAIGEIVLSSKVDGVFFPEYLDDPDATRKAVRGGKLFTGDLGRRLDNGEYVFVGRRTDSMRVRGENVSAWEVERVFAEHPAIKAAAAIGVPGVIGEEDIFLYVQFEPGNVVRWLDLVVWARPRLPSFQLPRYFEAIESFALTPSERIRKHLLPKTVSNAWDRINIEAAEKKEAVRG